MLMDEYSIFSNSIECQANLLSLVVIYKDRTESKIKNLSHSRYLCKCMLNIILIRSDDSIGFLFAGKSI